MEPCARQVSRPEVRIAVVFPFFNTRTAAIMLSFSLFAFAGRYRNLIQVRESVLVAM